MKAKDKEVVGFLWGKLKEEKCPQKRKEISSEIAEHYIGLVRIIASRISNRFTGYYEYDELVSMGFFGLLDAISKYSIGGSVKFETYASIRINGSILDQVRNMSYTTRSDGTKKKVLNGIREKLESKMLRECSSNELIEVVMKELRLTKESATKYVLNSDSLDIISSDSDASYFEVQDKTADIFTQIYENVVIKEISDVIDLLEDRLKNILSMSFYSKLTFKEIGLILNISEGRVSQLRTKALGKVKEELLKRKNIEIDFENFQRTA